MDTFIYAIEFKHSMFGLTGNGDIWRIWFSADYPLMERLSGNEPEYRRAIQLLKDQRDLYR